MSVTKRKKTEVKTKPAHHLQVGGVRIPIWENQGTDGPYFKAGEPELSYVDNAGQWHTAKSYGPRDLVNLMKAAALAHTEIGRRNRVAPPPADEPAESEQPAS